VAGQGAQVMAIVNYYSRPSGDRWKTRPHEVWALCLATLCGFATALLLYAILSPSMGAQAAAGLAFVGLIVTGIPALVLGILGCFLSRGRSRVSFFTVVFCLFSLGMVIGLWLFRSES
jgi:hypothetical protein